MYVCWFVAARWANENNNKNSRKTHKRIPHKSRAIARILSIFLLSIDFHYNAHAHTLFAFFSLIFSFPYRFDWMSEWVVFSLVSLSLALSFSHSVRVVSPWAQVKSSTKCVRTQWSGHTMRPRIYITIIICDDIIYSKSQSVVVYVSYGVCMDYVLYIDGTCRCSEIFWIVVQMQRMNRIKQRERVLQTEQ